MRARLTTAVAVLLLAAALGACSMMSKNPIGPESAALAEPGLSGKWLADSDGEIFLLLVFPKEGSEGKALHVLFAGGDDDSGGWYALDGHVSALPDGQRFLNLRVQSSIESAMAELDEIYPDRADYPYGFLPYRIVDADHVEFGAPPIDAAVDAVKEGRLPGTVAEGDFPIAKVTATSEELAAFLGALDAAAAFESPLKFTRIKKAAP